MLTKANSILFFGRTVTPPTRTPQAFEHLKLVLEPAAATGIAALLARQLDGQLGGGPRGGGGGGGEASSQASRRPQAAGAGEPSYDIALILCGGNAGFESYRSAFSSEQH